MQAGKPTRGEAAVEHLTVLLADDDAPFRAAIRRALEEDGLDVVFEAGDAATAVGAVSRLKPDICLLEIELPDDGLSAVGRIVKASPKTLVIVLSTSDRPEDVVAAFTRGASGYLIKGLSGERLASTLVAAHEGEPALSRSLVPHLVDEIRRGSVRRLVLPGGPVMLTARESEGGELLLEGYSTADMASRLGVSPVTVRRHIGLLLQKLGADSREDAVRTLRTYGRR